MSESEACPHWWEYDHDQRCWRCEYCPEVITKTAIRRGLAMAPSHRRVGFPCQLCGQPAGTMDPYLGYHTLSEGIDMARRA